MMSFGIVYSVFGYKLFQFLLKTFGLTKPEWIIDADTNEFDEYNIQVTLIRIFYFIVLYCCLIPLFLKKNLDQLKIVSIFFMIVIIVLIVDISIEASFFRSYFLNHPDPSKPFTVINFKKFNWSFIASGYSMMLSFYVQPLTLVLRKQLLQPTHRRLVKVAKLSIGFEVFIYLIFAGFIYYCFGEGRLPSLIILRKPFEGKSTISEYFFIAMIFLFMILNNIGLSTYNPGLTNYIKTFIPAQHHVKYSKLISLAPFLITFIIATLFPFILDLFWVIGLTFCNFNGFIVPAMMYIKCLDNEKNKVTKRLLAIFYIFMMTTLSLMGLTERIYTKFIK